jgi:lipopolysaccharide heptosyltransferase I
MPRLLIVKTSSLGDVIHNLPVIADIRAHFPDMQIDWLVEESFADIPRMHPGVSAVIPVAVRRWRKSLFSKATWCEIAACKRRLGAEKYDLVLDTQGLIKSAVLGSFAHAPYHGQDAKSAREPIAALLYQHKHHIPHGQHAVVRNRQLAAAALGYAMPDTPPDYGIAASDTKLSITLPARYIVGLHGTSRDSKLWPVKNWIELGQHLSRENLQLLLPWGNEAEHDRATEIAQSVAQAMVLPKLGLNELAGILAGAKAVVGVDTGLAHLAVALKVPTIAIYTDTDPSLTGLHPGGNSKAINLGGCSQIPSPETVIQSADQNQLSIGI